MAYFLKKTNNKKGTYLQIYNSFYDPERGYAAHKSYKALGYVHELQESGIDDPIAFYQLEVKRLNKQVKEEKGKEKQRQISDEYPEKFLGYFPIKNINESLGVAKYIDLMQSVTNYRFNVFSLISALVYSRIVCPCSKHKTFEQVFPRLFDKYDFSLNQVYSGLEYIGLEYEKIIEIYNHQIQRKYPFDTSSTYFDCTNFYFEIDRSDDFRKKGPSKENRNAPIVSMGLLLDAHQIPIGMKLFPGNESEKPVLRTIIDDLKMRNNITGRTVRVADKGLNCTENIVHALKAGDGYIFSKSVKQLPETEKKWVLLDNDYHDVKGKNGEILYRYKECIDDFPYTVSDENGRKVKIKLREKRVVTFNKKLADKQIFEINKQVERAKALKTAQAKRSEYGDCARYVTFTPTDKNGKETEGKIKVTLNEEAINKSKQLAGYNLIVTSETKMKASEIYSVYHNLWRIEESFRIMKSELDARPVYLQKKDTITGHFLICYLAVLLTRLFQIKILRDEATSPELFEFYRNFRVTKISENHYINMAKKTDFILKFANKTALPLTLYYLLKSQIKEMLSHKFQIKA